MFDNLSPTPFEEAIRQSFNAPEVRPEFMDHLQADLMRQAAEKSRKLRRFPALRPAWAVTLGVVALLTVAILAIGPQRVYAAVRQLFGYIPGVGIVEESAPLRMLSEPASLTRDGITVSVNQAILQQDSTRIDFTVQGVPLSAYPHDESVSGCMEREYLRMPDGTRLEITNPVPADVNDAVFVLPCIFNTLPETAPTGWEISLRFVPAPADITMLPVIEATETISAPQTTQAATPQPPAWASVERYIETETGYILIGAFQPQTPAGTWTQITGMPQIHDANGVTVSYDIPQDIELTYDELMGNGGFPWAYHFDAAGLVYPLTVSFSGVVITQVDPAAQADWVFDAGASPQPGQEWALNQDIQIGAYTIRLVSVTATQDGYTFRIDPGSDLSGVDVQIEGYTPAGGGGAETWGSVFNRSLAFAELPTGSLTLVFSHPRSASPTQTWEVQWSPDTLPANQPTPAASSACLDANSLAAINDLPTGLDAHFLLAQVDPDMQLIFSGEDGTDSRLLAAGSARGALSPDGTRLAYSSLEGAVMVVDVASGETLAAIATGGSGLTWSPDGAQIALVNPAGSYGLYVMNSDGSNLRPLSNLGYEEIAGWSADENEIYYSIPGATQDGWLLRAVNVATGDTRDLFTLIDSSLKAPMAQVSPDGSQVVYRSRSNAGVYWMSMDGSQRRLLLDDPGIAVSGMAWEQEGHLLAASLITEEDSAGEVLLMQVDNCEMYRLPALHGTVKGIVLP